MVVVVPRDREREMCVQVISNCFSFSSITIIREREEREWEDKNRIRGRTSPGISSEGGR